MGDSAKSALAALLGGLLYVGAMGALLVLVIDPRAVDASQIIAAVVAVVGFAGTGTAVLWRWGPGATSRRSSTIEKLAVGALDGRLRTFNDSRLDDLGVRAPRDASQVGQLQPSYAPREKLDPMLEQALLHRRFILVRGPSAAGKSRSTAEAARRVMGERRVLIPVLRQDALATLLDVGAVRSGVVVWLSDLEKHVAVGVDAPLLEGFLRIEDVTVVATIRDRSYQRLAPQGELRPHGRDVVELAIKHRGLCKFDNWDVADRQAATMLYADQRPDIAEALMKGRGLGEYLVAGPEMIERLDSGQSPGAAAVVRATSDWYRAGMTRPAPLELVRRTYGTYLPPDDVTLVQEFDSALRWACEPVTGARALTQPTDKGGLVVHEYVLDHWAQLQAPIPETTWDAIVDALDDAPEDAVTASIAAFELHNNPAASERLARSAAEKGIMSGHHAMGVLLTKIGRTPEAEPWIRAAAEANHAAAMSNLGILLRQQGHLAESERWLRAAAAQGHAGGMRQLGILLQERGDLKESERWTRAAADAGDPSAMGRLRTLLVKRDELLAAERWALAAAKAGDPSSMGGLAHLLEKRGESKEAERWARAGAQAGHAGSMQNLGYLVQKRGRLDEAEHWYRAAINADDNAFAMHNLGHLLQNRGQLDEAEHWFRAAINADVDDNCAMHNLGHLLQRRGQLDEAEHWYRAAINADDTNAMNNLGILLEKRGNLVEAEHWYRAATNADDTNAMNNLGILLEKRGNLVEAERWYRAAAEAGNPVAMHNLARRLRKRWRLVSAIRWASRSAFLMSTRR